MRIEQSERHRSGRAPAPSVPYREIMKRCAGLMLLVLSWMTCFRFSGPMIAGKFQFSGTCDSGRWTGNSHEAIEVHGGADSLHPAAGMPGTRIRLPMPPATRTPRPKCTRKVSKDRSLQASITESPLANRYGFPIGTVQVDLTKIWRSSGLFCFFQELVENFASYVGLSVGVS
jgi:hypothetical protein